MARDDPWNGPAKTAEPTMLQRLADRLTSALDSVAPALRARARDLPAGHPSSPFLDDGARRPDEPSLKDVEVLTPPLSDADWADHLHDFNTSSDKACAAGLTTDRLHTTNSDRDIWSDDRTKWHDIILNDIYAAASAVPCDRKAVIAGGLPGAGKTTVLDLHAGLDRSEYLVISPDDFKEELASRGLLPSIPGLSPMEASALAHAESSYLARRLAHRATADGKNLIWDITMSSVETTAGRIDELRQSNYRRVDGIFVDVPIETSVARAEARHRRGHDQYLAGEGLGGRPFPAELIRSQADPDYGSTYRRHFEMVKDKLNNWTVYDNSVDERDPIIVEHRDEATSAD